jgi:AAA15 family ATPase/GTPase
MKHFMDLAINYKMAHKGLNIYSNLKMIGCKDDTEIKYGFKVDGVEGYYLIKFNNMLKSEQLYYLIDKNRGLLFDINHESKKITTELNDSIFYDKKYKQELSSEIKKYWGNHTFLSIIVSELITKHENFIKTNISTNLLKVISLLRKMTVVCNSSTRSKIKFRNIKDESIYFNLMEGTVDVTEQKYLDNYGQMLRLFFTQAYPDIKNVFYKKESKGNNINYELYFEKIIDNKPRSILYDLESTGTKQILSLFDSFLGALQGEIVVIDEIDNGIHDVLMEKIIDSIKDKITGQIIISTHNTLLLKSLKKDNIYVIVTDSKGQKEINCVSNYDFKIQKNNNIEELYLKGMFGGVPLIDIFDFDEIKKKMKQVK